MPKNTRIRTRSRRLTRFTLVIYLIKGSVQNQIHKKHLKMVGPKTQVREEHLNGTQVKLVRAGLKSEYRDPVEVSGGWLSFTVLQTVNQTM